MSAALLLKSFDKGEATPLGKMFRFTPVLGGGLGIFTMILCIIITRSTGIDTGGLSWPYVSDTGREGAAYFVFAIFVTITAIFVLTAFVVNHHRLEMLRQRVNAGTGFNVARWVMLFFGALSCVGFSLLAIISSMMDADTHLYSAYAAFVGLTIYVCTNTALLWRARAIANEASRDALVPSKLIIVKTVVTCVAFLMFLIYIPVGLAVLCEWQQDPISKLYDYRNCLDIHIMRAVTQHLFVWSCLFYVLTLYHDFAPPNMVAGEDIVVGQPALSSIEVIANPAPGEDKA
jgi:hypothetical protein